MSKAYANAITSVLGTSAMDSQGRGGTFSIDKIPAILAKLLPGYNEDTFKTVINKMLNHIDMTVWMFAANQKYFSETFKGID